MSSYDPCAPCSAETGHKTRRLLCKSVSPVHSASAQKITGKKMFPSRPRETMFDYKKGVGALLNSGSLTEERVEAQNATEEILATTNNTVIGQISRPDTSKMANKDEGHKRKRTVEPSAENDVHNFLNLFVPYEPWTMHKLICAIRDKTHSFKSKDRQSMFEDLITKKEFKLSKIRSLIITWAPRVMNRQLKPYEVTIASNYVAENLLRKN